MSSTVDPFADLKTRQREMWASFAPTAVFTTPVAARLVEFAKIKPGEIERLATLRAEFEALAAPYYFGNAVRQEYLLTRAKAR